MPRFTDLIAPRWEDYELLDSGDGLKLERFGRYRFIRPETEAVWKPRLPQSRWAEADGVYANSQWQWRKPVEARWRLHYGAIQFWCEATPFRHLGVFPEQAAQWDWLREQTAGHSPVRVLNLFAYTGIASLVAASAGAQVTHVDSAKNTVAWARENAELSGLAERPVRWIVDDALKFTEREARRGVKYDAILMDPPPFGHGAKGEVWKYEKSMPLLLDACRAVLSDSPKFIILTAYNSLVTPASLHADLTRLMSGYRGQVEAGTLSMRESSGERAIKLALFARWSVT
ncbi:MAG: class I SAM-dependent methyltransferase [Anaerolineae bacterium]